MKLLSLTLIGLMVPAAGAQVLFNAEAGIQSTQYGSSYDSSYKNQPKYNVPVINTGVGLTFGSPSDKTSGSNVLLYFDGTLPTNLNQNTGGVVIYGGTGMFNFRHRSVTVGVGMDMHDFSFPQDKGNAAARPNQLVIGVPVIGKFDFARHHAYVQGGMLFPFALQTDTFASPTSLVDISTNRSASRFSEEVRLQAGYVFGRIAVRANYIDRNYYFDVTNGITYPSYYDFHQQTFTAGVVLLKFK